MKVRLTAIALIMSAPFAPTVFAQSVGSEVQRDINQENRIEQGLQSGQLSTKEAAREDLIALADDVQGLEQKVEGNEAAKRF